MAAPLIISRQRFGGPLADPGLSTGEGQLSQELAGINRLAETTIGGAERIANVTRRGSAGLANATLAGADRVAGASIAAAEREGQAEIGAIRAEAGATLQASRSDVQANRAITDQAIRGSEAQVQFAGALAQSMQRLGNQIMEAAQTTRLTQASTKLLTGYEEARSAFRNDADWETAPTRLRERLKQVEDDVFKGFGTVQQEQLRASTLRARLGLEREVEQTSVAKMGNAAIAAQTEASQLRVNQASRSPSAAERQGLIDENDRAYDDLASKGIIEKTQALTAKQNFRQQLDQTELYKGIQANPAGTIEALKNPDMFKSLSPEQRERSIQAAQSALDERRTLEASDQYKRDPVGAAITYSRDATPAAVSQLVRGGLLPRESGSNPNVANSPKGAAGIAQFMPGTARAVAQQMGWKDLDGLDDTAVRAWLSANPERGVQMAEKLVGDAWKRYGNPATALVEYHAGRGTADVYHRKAVEAFGPGYSAAQLMSLLPDSLHDGTEQKPGTKTRDYVAQILQKAGADPGRGGVSYNAALRIASNGDAAIKREQAENLQQLQRLVSVTQDDRDAVTSAFKKGYATSPEEIAAVKTPLIAAANAGDAGAVQKLRQFTELEQAAPLVRAAYQMPPPVLEQQVAQLRQAVATGGASAPAQRALQVFEAVQTEVAQQRNENPVALMERAGRAPVTPVALPPQGLPGGDRGFGEAVAARAQVATDAQRIYGGEIKPFRPEEARELKTRWEQAGPHERYETVRGLAGSLPLPAYQAAVKQIAGDNEVAAIAGLVGQRNTEAGRMIMQGVALLGQPGVDAKAAELRPALQNVLGRDVFPGKVQEALISAAQAHYVASRAGKGALFDAGDPAAMEASMEAVIGRMAKRAGVKVPLPPGMRPAQLDTVMDGLTEAELGGAPLGLGGQPIDMAHLRRQARLRPMGLGDGVYSLTLPGPGGKDAPVLAAGGGPLVIDVGAIAARRAPAIRGETMNDVRRETIARGAPMMPQDWQGPVFRGEWALPNVPDRRTEMSARDRVRRGLENMKWQGARPAPEDGE